MGDVVENREWYVAAYCPEGIPTSDHLKLRTVSLSLASDSIPDNHLAVETLLLSVDPFLRGTITGTVEGLFISQYQLGQVPTTFAVVRVIRSNDSNYSVGDLLLNAYGLIAEYSIVPSSHIIRKIDTSNGISLSDYLGSLGVPGFAAWLGIEVLGDPKPGSNVFISAASGAVGMNAGQLAKIRGCRVIGSTGSDDKVKLIKEQFGYDDGFNYNTEPDFDAALSKSYFPDGIDVYLDNVGGKMLEAVLNHVNNNAKIPLCGMISQYNKVWTEREGVRNLLNMVGKEVRMEGFMVKSYLHRFGDFVKDMEGYLQEGKIKPKSKINIGIESFLESLNSVFSSSNIGKVVVQVKTDVCLV